MKKYTKSDPTFNEEITITEPTDPGHADNINAAPKQIFENTLANKKEIEKGDSKERTITFTSGDVEGDAATEWSDVEKMVSGEKHKSLFNKISTMFKNVRYLYNVLGSEDLSQIGAGTVTGIVAALKQAAFLNPTNNLLATILGTSLDAVQGRILKEGQDALQDQITQINSDLQFLNFSGDTILNFYLNHKNSKGCFILNIKTPEDLPDGFTGEGYIEFLRDESSRRCIVKLTQYNSFNPLISLRSIFREEWSGNWIKLN